MRYSFDEYGIGLLRKGESVCCTREIKRPRGITRDEWYRHAAEVCAILNKTKRA